METTEAEGFRISAAKLEQAVTKRTKAIVLNSPSNPTGLAYDRATLEAVAAVAVKHRIYVISDEIEKPSDRSSETVVPAAGTSRWNSPLCTAARSAKSSSMPMMFDDDAHVEQAVPRDGIEGQRDPGKAEMPSSRARTRTPRRAVAKMSVPRRK